MQPDDSTKPVVVREPDASKGARPVLRGGSSREARSLPSTERKNHLDTLAMSLLVACCLFWGFQQLLIKTIVAEVPPLFCSA